MPSLKNSKADLRKLYQRTLEINLIVSLAILIAAFKFSPEASEPKLILEGFPGLITVEDIANTVQKPDVPPPPKAQRLIAATIDDLSDDLILTDIDDVKPIDLPDKPPTKPDIDLSDEIFIEIPEEQELKERFISKQRLTKMVTSLMQLL